MAKFILPTDSGCDLTKQLAIENNIEILPMTSLAAAHDDNLCVWLCEKLTTSLADFKFSSWQGKERFEYGLGIGAGINVWKLQLIARYNWNFGSLYNVEGWDDIKSELKGLSAENENFGGVTLTLCSISWGQL